MGDVATLDARPQGPALDRLGQDDGRGALELGRRPVGGVELAIVVTAPPEPGQVIVGEVFHERAETRVRTEEVLPDVGPADDRVLLVLPVECLVHLVDEGTVRVARQELVPLATPDHLDHVPAGAAEDPLQLLDDLAVAADGAVEALEVAVDDEGQVVEPLAAGNPERTQGLRLVHLPVAQEGPDTRGRCVRDPPLEQVAVEARLVDGRDWPEAHADGGELPEVGHEPRMRIRAEAPARDRLAAEVVELLLAQASLQERPGVHPGRRVALVEDLVAGPVVLAPEEVVEAHFVEAGRAGIRGQVAADPGVGVVRAQHHRRCVPADEAADPALDGLVAGEGGFLLGADRVDVAGLGQRREADVALARPLEQLVGDEPGALGALLVEQLVERLDPVLGLRRIDVRELLLEVVAVHRGLLRDARRGPRCRRGRRRRGPDGA